MQLVPVPYKQAFYQKMPRLKAVCRIVPSDSGAMRRELIVGVANDVEAVEGYLHR